MRSVRSISSDHCFDRSALHTGDPFFSVRSLKSMGVENQAGEENLKAKPDNVVKYF